jgi:nucleoside-specific outer membrane channel protein Tsx
MPPKGTGFVTARFSYFITEFWSKKTVHEDFNDYEVNSDLKEELRDYNNPYSYFA